MAPLLCLPTITFIICFARFTHWALSSYISELTAESVNLCVHFGRTPWISPFQGLSAYTGKHEHIHASSRILRHDLSVRVVQYHAHLRLCSRWDRHLWYFYVVNQKNRFLFLCDFDTLWDGIRIWISKLSWITVQDNKKYCKNGKW